MGILSDLVRGLLATLIDVTPIVVILLGFQILVLRQRPAHLRRILVGLAYVLAGLALFLVGLEEALFPLGETMAQQLTVASAQASDSQDWRDFAWMYAFAAAIGFATTVAEPALIAVSLKAEEISGGALSARGLRVAVAVGAAFGVTLGVLRIVTGMPLPLFISAGYVVVVLLTARTARTIIPLAYDSGGVTTSTITVPVVAALGLGLAENIPGRSPLIDGFGLIAFTCLFPIISVMGYAMIMDRIRHRAEARQRGSHGG
jgi:hypothetical protein